MMEVASSMRDIARAVLTDSAQGNGLASPERRRAAIQSLEDDGELSENDQVKVIRLIQHQTSIADSILAIKNKRTRALYLRAELNELDII